MSFNSNDSDLGQSVDSVSQSSSIRKRSRVPGKANKRPVQRCVRSDFWVSMRFFPLLNTTMTKSWIELFYRILHHSASENVQASRFILGGIDYGLHGDFDPDLLTDAICESRLHERWTLMDFIERNPDHKWKVHSNLYTKQIIQLMMQLNSSADLSSKHCSPWSLVDKLNTLVQWLARRCFMLVQHIHSLWLHQEVQGVVFSRCDGHWKK